MSIKTANAGHVCASPQVAVLDRDWPQADQFIDAIRTCASTIGPPFTWYAGNKERMDAVKDAYPEAEIIGENQFVFVPDIGENSYLLENEVFGPCLGIKFISSGNQPEKFLKDVVPLVNEQFFGSLSCSIFIHPTVEAQHSDHFEACLGDIDWGTIGVNQWGLWAAVVPSSVCKVQFFIFEMFAE
jgi:hypothetical protein